MTADHAALRAAIDDAGQEVRAAFAAMWEALRTGTPQEYADRLAAWQRANVRHSALIEAGLLITLGKGEEAPHDDETV